METEQADKNQTRHDFIKKLAEKVRQDDQDRQSWKDKQVVAHNARLGLRRRTNRPYPGASEVPIPITDKFIKKLKAIYVSVATQNKKGISVTLDQDEDITPETKMSAKKIETALNNLVKKKDFQWAKKVTLFCDYFLENGHALFKVIEKFFDKSVYRTINMDNFNKEQLAQFKALSKDEQRLFISKREELDIEDEEDLEQIDSIIKQYKSGKKIIKFKKRVTYSEPTVIPERGLRIIVPYSATSVDTLPRICHDMWLSYQQLRELADEGIYDKEVVNALDPDGGASDDSLNNVSWSVSEGVANDNSRSGLFNVRETQTYYDGERWVFTWIEDAGAKSNPTKGDDYKDVKVLQEARFTRPFWSYVKHDLELKNTRWYASRGIPEQVRGLHQTIEKMFNARLIRDEYNNAPMWRVSKQLGMAGDEIRFRPGQVVEAEAGEIEQINKGVTVDVSSERLEQQAKAYAEEYLSLADSAMRNAVNEGGVRTATEIQAAQQNTARQMGMDIALFMETLSEVANQLYMILKQSVDVPKKVGGVLLTPEDFMVKVNVSWQGSVDSTDSQLQMGKSLTRLQVLQQMGVPMGVVTPKNVYNGLKGWLEADPDLENPLELITSPEDVLVSEVEEQQSEIVRMMNGFDTQVHPDDNDAVHLQVIEEYANSPQAQQLMKQNPVFAEMLEKHANLHIQSEAMKNGQKVSPQKSGDKRSQVARSVVR